MYAAVEGVLDESVVRRLIRHVGAETGPVLSRNGKGNLRKQIGSYNASAHTLPWFVLVDLNSDAACAPALRREWIPHVAARMCFRVAVREVEAWILADRQRVARFLGVPATKVPLEPEAIDDPKRVVVNLARRSSRRDICEDLVPRPKSGRLVGPGYTSQLSDFVGRSWRPEVAAANADSLRRALDCLRRLVAGEG